MSRQNYGVKYRMCPACKQQQHVNKFVKTSEECRNCRDNVLPARRKLRPQLPSPTERERAAANRETARAEEHIRKVRADLERRPVPILREPLR